MNTAVEKKNFQKKKKNSISKMSECCQRPCRQRFKGVENFLRRVAFNLGNTASQTEVKIISCIPIDVTDLQQKIINLEKQLCEAQGQICKGKNSKCDKNVTNSRSSTLVNTAFYNSAFAKESSNLSYCRNSQDDINVHHVAIHCDNCSREKKSTVSFVPPTACETSKLDSCATSNNVGQKANLAMERYKDIFRTRIKKKNKGKGNFKTHLVYYAQTPNNGFNINQNRRKIDSVEALCRSHLDNIVKKQYDPNIMVEEFSDTSHFTSPICRDINEGFKHCFDCNSDVCSGCYGAFQNIDRYMSTKRNYNDYIPEADEAGESNGMLRNANDYDLIPVKENSFKNLSKKETKIDIDIKCWPELLRTKQRHHPLIVNYQTKFIPKSRHIPRDTQKNQAKLQTKVINKKYKTNQLNVHTILDLPSKRGFVECSDVYKKHRRPKNYLRKSEPVKVIVLKNEVTSTNGIEQQDAQRAASELNTVDDTKTESTLDQIKTLLQNVLTEIKTSGKLSNSADESIKKDAIVQKSLNNIQGASTLLNSFTYNNSYNVNPYAASYSRQVPYCVSLPPYQPMKVENFPVFIHSSPKKHMCMCYCKNNVYKQTNTATNTGKDKQAPATNETEKLIKEIYNSMALNLDLTTKDNSMSECGDIKSTDGSTNTPWKVNSRRSAGINANKRDIEVEALLTSLDSYSKYSLTTHTAATQSDRSRRTETLYHINNKGFGRAKNLEGARNFAHDRREHGRTIVEDDENEESSDETDSVNTVVTNRREEDKIEKKSLLQRMLKSVKLFRTKKHESQKRFDNEDVESDSDDYETIYSKQSTIPPPPKLRKNPRKYAKDNYLPEVRRKKPYLEQEYRRQWNENLTFHNQTHFSNDNQYPRNYKNTPFWTNYEARNVTVETPNYMNPRPPSYEKSPKTNVKRKDKLKWLKNHKLGLKCGKQWKNFILEN